MFMCVTRLVLLVAVFLSGYCKFAGASADRDLFVQLYHPQGFLTAGVTCLSH